MGTSKWREHNGLSSPAEKFVIAFSKRKFLDLLQRKKEASI